MKEHDRHGSADHAVTAYVLYHTLGGDENVRVRREIVARGLKDRISFRNVYWPEDREAFDALRGSRTPALWDGERLHEGEDAVMRALRDIIPPR